MNKLKRGYTLAELLFVIVGVGGFGLGLWLVSLVVRALMKYIGA